MAETTAGSADRGEAGAPAGDEQVVELFGQQGAVGNPIRALEELTAGPGAVEVDGVIGHSDDVFVGGRCERRIEILLGQDIFTDESVRFPNTEKRTDPGEFPSRKRVRIPSLKHVPLREGSSLRLCISPATEGEGLTAGDHPERVHVEIAIGVGPDARNRVDGLEVDAVIGGLDAQSLIVANRSDPIAQAGVVERVVRLIRGGGFVVCPAGFDADGREAAGRTSEVDVGRRVDEDAGPDRGTPRLRFDRDPIDPVPDDFDLREAAVCLQTAASLLDHVPQDGVERFGFEDDGHPAATAETQAIVGLVGAVTPAPWSIRVIRGHVFLYRDRQRALAKTVVDLLNDACRAGHGFVVVDARPGARATQSVCGFDKDDGCAPTCRGHCGADSATAASDDAYVIGDITQLIVQ